MLKAINLEKTYRTKTGTTQKALDKINVEFEDKGLIFIFGKSGSGKSTLLNILGGLDSMDSGYIEVEGKSTIDFTKDDFDSYRNTYLGFIFQDFNILPEFTVSENINLAYELQHKKTDKKRLNEILKQVEMEEYADRKPNELSGGQIQRVSIARALIKNPQIIMADEPTGNLDSETGEQVFKTLKSLAKEKLVIVVSHDKDAADKYADRVIELKDGKVISDLTRQNNTDSFIKTNKINQQEQLRPLNLIKSKLPNNVAFKMGRSSLKHKKGRLILALFLTIISITLLGLSDVISTFSVSKASYNTYENSTYSLLPFVKEEYSSETDQTENIPPTAEQISAFEELSNQKVYEGYSFNTEFFNMVHNEIPYYNDYYIKFITGVIELPDETAIQETYEGNFPTNANEIMINNYMLEHFIDYGFEYLDVQTDTTKFNDNVTSFSDIQDKTVKIRVGMNFVNFKIVGMINYDLSKYAPLKEKWSAITEHSNYLERKDIDFSADQNTFLGRFIVAEGFNQVNFIDNLSSQSFSVANQGNDQDINIELIELTPPDGLGDVELDKYLNKDRIDFSELKIINTDDYYFGVNGVPTNLGENDIIVPSSWFGTTNETELDNYLNTKVKFKLVTNNFVTDEYDRTDYQNELNIVGFYTGDLFYMNYNVVISNKVFDEVIDLTTNNADYMYTYLNHDNSDTTLFNLLDSNNYKHNTSLSEGIYRVADLFGIMKQIFFYVSLIMFVLVILLVMNFMTTSIIYKQKEIGILRALGARKLDVFKIFYFEGLIIGIISFVFTIILLLVGIVFFNTFIQDAMQTDTVLVNLGIRQILLVGIVCFGTILLASYLPVNKIARKNPIDAIRGH